MLIHELSKLTGISSHTIRFYEKSGLIKGKRSSQVTSNNYFHYGAETVEKLELIRDAKSVGFTLREIAALIDVWYSNKLSVPSKLNVLGEKLAEIDARIKRLREMKKLIVQFKRTVEDESC